MENTAACNASETKESVHGMACLPEVAETLLNASIVMETLKSAKSIGIRRLLGPQNPRIQRLAQSCGLHLASAQGTRPNSHRIQLAC